MSSFFEATDFADRKRKNVEEAFGRLKGRWRISRKFEGIPDSIGTNDQNGALRDRSLVLNGAIGSIDSTQVELG